MRKTYRAPNGGAEITVDEAAGAELVADGWIEIEVAAAPASTDVPAPADVPVSS